MNIAEETFQATGLRPANTDVLSDEDFLASEVINRPQGNMKENPPGETGKELQMSLSIEKKVSDGSKSKGKAVPLQAWTDPEGSRKLRFTDFMTKAQDGGKIVSLTHRPPLTPGNTPGTHFC